MGERASEINTEKRRKRRTLTIFLATEKIIVLLMLGTMITIQTRGKGDAQRLIVLSAPVIVCIARARARTETLSPFLVKAIAQIRRTSALIQCARGCDIVSQENN